MIRRLDPIEDCHLYKKVFEWSADYPRWYQDSEKVAGLSLDEFLKEAPKRADIGIFNKSNFVGMVSVLRRAKGLFEAHIWMKRQSDIEAVAEIGMQIRHCLERDLGMQAGFVWIVKKNLPIKRLCAMIGLLPDGASVIDGESHGKPIEWIRLSTN